MRGMGEGGGRGGGKGADIGNSWLRVYEYIYSIEG